MKLPDFTRSIDFIRLRQQMDAISIPILPKVEFVQVTNKKRVVKEIDKKDKRLLEKLRSGIEVTDRDLQSEKGFLTVGGRKIVAYIRDQRAINYDGTSGYRFHLMDCTTMQSMRAAGRERRYVATQRSDGFFEVNYFERMFFGSTTSPLSRRGNVRKTTLKLELCQHCWWELVQRRHYSYNNKESFSLEEFFKKHDSSVPRTVIRIEMVEMVQEYQPNQDDLSREYRKAANYHCQICKVGCCEKKGLLQLHHADGDTSNNAHHNLAVLCVECHSGQPYHGQIGGSAIDQAKIAQIRDLRRQQNLEP